MLDIVTIKTIEDFVYQKPRSIQEIAQHIGKNWRTADRYIGDIEKNFGTLATRVFRGGTRGALKIVYWASVEKISSSVFQERLEKEILRTRRKEDFSAFDIFQHISNKAKEVHIEKEKTEERLGFQNIKALFEKVQKQLLIFSGNLSFIHYRQGDQTIFDILDALVKKGTTIKILCRVDFAARENIEKVLALNFKYGKEMIEIHHREHPLRATIVDGKMFHIKEIKEPTGKIHELDKKIFIFYTIKDKEWSEWLTKIFWKMFAESIGSEKRLRELQRLR